MPCYDPRGQVSGLQEDLNDVQRELDQRTRDLCLVMKIMRESSPQIYKQLPATLIGWHLAHQDFDNKQKR